MTLERDPFGSRTSIFVGHISYNYRMGINPSFKWYTLRFNVRFYDASNIEIMVIPD